ncbi:glycosyl hydrolase family 95 catalytic domain-containing protein [Thermoactinospora rubra]|uniref:glycosyl hydrolase family 95 catalytic domain-containing protein n=1 Tax=Thermoactinospora rubra TaxID=1088767 RepID=UPI000A117F2E|nr:glycoside hydrolase N-terminal domain-containing protein [Thermoactinospora rubra]
MRFFSRTRTGDWERALVTGNGRQGALVYGGHRDLRVTLSHERLFLPVTRPLDPPATARILPELRGLLYAGRRQEAADRVVELAVRQDPGYAETRWIDPLIGAATLALEPPAPVTAYRRSCDLRTGVVTQECDGGRQEVFVSRAADAVVIRCTGLAGVLRLAPVEGEPPIPIGYRLSAWPAPPAPHGEPARDAGLVLHASFPEHWPGALTGYQVECRVTGPATPVPGGLRLPGDALVLARVVIPGREPYPPLEDLPADFDALLAGHARQHAELMDRSAVRLGHGGKRREACSEDLLAGGGPELVEAVFDAARYAIVSSCGELPPTLQGVWSGTFTPAWQSGYTIDGNLQTAVAGLHPTGAPELMLPVFDLFDRLVPDFRDNARALYGCRGILTPAHVSTHGRHNHFGPIWCQTFWTAGAAWLARLYYDHYSYTQDAAFLRDRALPFMVEAAEFYEDFLDEHGNFVPSYSPENAPPGSRAQACVNATMDIAAVRDLVRNLRRVDPRPRWDRLAARLPGYRVAPGGELAEWAWDLEDNHAHRHASHLYPFWYEGDEAARGGEEAVRRRLAWWRGSESDEMAFGLVQLGLAAARLGMAAEAHEALTLLVTRYWRANMVSTHNRDAIFNVDVCGGVPALVAAMLVRSSEESLDLLPACPWPRGEARGLRARGGVTVECLAWWPGGGEARLTSLAPRTLHVNGRPVDLAGGVTITW